MLSHPHRSSARASDSSAAPARLDAAAAAPLAGAGEGAGTAGVPEGLGRGLGRGLGVLAGGEGEGVEAGGAGAGAGVRLLVLTALEPPAWHPTLNFSFICTQGRVRGTRVTGDQDDRTALGRRQGSLPPAQALAAKPAAQPHPPISSARRP